MAKKGFTLIELLVVVIIVAILGAIALPQYQRASEKSRHTQLLTMVKNAAQAQERYLLTNSAYTDSFADLDVSFDGGATKPAVSNLGPTVSSTDAVRRFDDKNFEIIINHAGQSFNGIVGSYYAGRFKGGYILYYFVFSGPVPLRTLTCGEDNRNTVFTQPQGSFCVNTMGFKNYVGTAYNTRYYTQG